MSLSPNYKHLYALCLLLEICFKKKKIEICFHLEQRNFSLTQGAIISFCYYFGENTHIKPTRKALPKSNYISNRIYMIYVNAFQSLG